MPYRTELRETMSHIVEAINELKEFIAATPVAAGMVFELPPVLAEEEHAPVTFIPVTSHSDPFSAAAMACRAIGQFYASPGSNVSTKSTFRLPGCLLLTPVNVAHGLQLIERVNTLKQQFADIVAENIPETNKRFVVLHEHLFPGLITLQLYRKIIAVAHPLQSIRFSWANKQSITSPTREELLTQLKRAQQKPGRSLLPDDYEAWVESVAKEINLIQSLPGDSQFRIRRPVKVQPMIRFAPVLGYSGAAPKPMSCPLPAIVFLRNDEHIPIIRPLSPYDKNQIKHRRPPLQRQDLELLIPRLHLYRLL